MAKWSDTAKDITNGTICLKWCILKKKLNLYQPSNLATVRKLHITQTVLRKPVSKISRRRKDIVVQVPKVNTTFANRQSNKRSTHLCNLINKEIAIYVKTYRDRKKLISTWLQSKLYEETKDPLEHLLHKHYSLDTHTN